MKRIVIKLEYKCFPMWIYDDAILLKNDLIDDLRADTTIDESLTDIQNTYDALFIDDGIEFCYKGFSSEKEKTIFKRAIENATEYIESKGGDRYIIDQEIDFDKI